MLPVVGDGIIQGEAVGPRHIVHDAEGGGVAADLRREFRALTLVSLEEGAAGPQKAVVVSDQISRRTRPSAAPGRIDPLEHQLRVREQRIVDEGAHRNASADQMEAVHVIVHLPVPHGQQGRIGILSLREIDLHDAEHAARMDLVHQLPQLGAGIVGMGEPAVRREVHILFGIAPEIVRELSRCLPRLVRVQPRVGLDTEGVVPLVDGHQLHRRKAESPDIGNIGGSSRKGAPRAPALRRVHREPADMKAVNGELRERQLRRGLRLPAFGDGRDVADLSLQPSGAGIQDLLSSDPVVIGELSGLQAVYEDRADLPDLLRFIKRKLRDGLFPFRVQKDQRGLAALRDPHGEIHPAASDSRSHTLRITAADLICRFLSHHSSSRRCSGVCGRFLPF